METAKNILKQAYCKQNEATEKLREIYEFGQDLSESQRNNLLNAINAQSSVALYIHNTIQSLKN